MQHTKKEVVKKSLDLEITVQKVWRLSCIERKKKLKKWTGKREKMTKNESELYKEER